MALGVAWILDGLKITIAGSIAGVLGKAGHPQHVIHRDWAGGNHPPSRSGDRRTVLWQVVCPSWTPPAIAVFFAIAQCFGTLGPVFYGWLIGDGTDRTSLFIGYLIGAGIMILGGVIEVLFGVNAEGKSLENVARPLTAVDDIPDDLSADASPATRI